MDFNRILIWKAKPAASFTNTRKQTIFGFKKWLGRMDSNHY